MRMALPPPDDPPQAAATRATLTQRVLDGLERLGNLLPDPAVLVILCLLATWIISSVLAGVEYADIDPRTGEPIRVVNQLTGATHAGFLANMVTKFTWFAPLGVVLVALLGVGVAEHSGLINACLKGLLCLGPRTLLALMLILVAIGSRTAADAGYVLVITLGA
jgi:aminobenzoyl-glutamate transport protein